MDKFTTKPISIEVTKDVLEKTSILDLKR